MKKIHYVLIGLAIIIIAVIWVKRDVIISKIKGAVKPEEKAKE